MSRILIGILNFCRHCRNTRPRRVPIGATCQMNAGFRIYLKRGPNSVHRIEAFLERLDPSPPRLEPVTPPKIVSSLTTKKLQFFFRYFPQFSTLMEIPHEKPWKIAEDITLKAGSSPPPSRGGNLADHKGLHLQSISPPIGKMAVQIDSVTFCQFTF
jgi:hypothetical protein